MVVKVEINSKKSVVYVKGELSEKNFAILLNIAGNVPVYNSRLFFDFSQAKGSPSLLQKYQKQLQNQLDTNTQLKLIS